ncbi:transmembrane protein 41B [Neodiprion pinetum]|uniref:Transmembrane protein 41B n=1 Tax=Neodiprion lecontei TaxID=441921 RepID=A0A6J0BLD7_NEOLC|nr:transmembrane protein 41B [Neodiprion lecontei]XP_046486615.1 transmembrane protein 41B [Neodiprion pinetum]
MSTMVSPRNDGGSVVTVRTTGLTTYIVIEIAEEFLARKFDFENFVSTDLKHTMNAKVKAKTVPPNELLNSETSTQQAIFTVGLIFCASLIALFYVYASFPELAEDEKKDMKLPFDIEDAKSLGKLLDRYKDRYYFQVLAGLFITYIFLQTFAIPGSIFLSILSGFLFPFPLALVLVCTCSAIGATLCYLLSSILGRKLLYKYFPDKANEWAVTVTKHKHNLLSYMLFLRMTPLLPNWFINLASPVIGVPMIPFTIGTFFGVAPPSFVAIQAGQTLHKLTSSRDAFSWTSIIVLCLFAVLSLVPVVLKQRFRQKFD